MNLFQFTHPLRGATRYCHARLEVEDVSIHAPLAGCDPGGGLSLRIRCKFQFTHPLRGAT